MHAVDVLMAHGMSAQPLVETQVRALDQQVVVHLPQHRREPIGIIEAPFAAGVARMESISRQGLAAGYQAFEQAGGMALVERAQAPARRVAGLEVGGMRREGPDDHPLGDGVRAQDGERVPVEGGYDRVDLMPIETPALGRLHIQVVNAGTFQISWAYSLIARSDENHPIWATFSMAERRHAAWSPQRRSTSRCAAA